LPPHARTIAARKNRDVCLATEEVVGALVIPKDQDDLELVIGIVVG
jgi:hypothetical protein